MRPALRLLSSLPPTIRHVLKQGLGNEPKNQVVKGWIKSARVHRNVTFLEVDDGTDTVQAVLRGQQDGHNLDQGSGVSLVGKLQASKGKCQDVEFLVDELKVLGKCDPETYPIQKKQLPPAFLREHAHLRFRTAQTAAIMHVRDRVMREWHDWYEANDFVHIHTPILTSNDCEGAGESFTLLDPISSQRTESSISNSQNDSGSAKVEAEAKVQAAVGSSASPSPEVPEPFFPRPVSLTVSSQLHLEAPTHSLSRVYTLSPSFRAEPSQTNRHLSEFYMMEAEISFIDTLNQLLDVVEGAIKDVLKAIIWGNSERSLKTREDLETINMYSSHQSENEGIITEEETSETPLKHLLTASSKPFMRITYTEALELLEKVNEDLDFGTKFEKQPPKWGEGIPSEHEKFLAEHAGGPVFITHYPEIVKPFYMLPSNADPSFSPSSSSSSSDGGGGKETLNGKRHTVACFDLIFPGIGELIGGSLREHRLENLELKLKERKMNIEEYQWYLDLRRFGSVPHGGWGMGWDRFICWITGVKNIRDVVAFPRWKGECRY